MNSQVIHRPQNGTGSKRHRLYLTTLYNVGIQLSISLPLPDLRVNRTDQNLSGLEAFSFDYLVKWPLSLVLNRKVSALDITVTVFIV